MALSRHTEILSETIKLLKQLQQEKGLSHEALAKKSGITRSAVSHIEAGKRNPSLLIALKLTQALDIELSDILDKVEKSIPR